MCEIKMRDTLKMLNQLGQSRHQSSITNNQNESDFTSANFSPNERQRGFTMIAPCLCGKANKDGSVLMAAKHRPGIGGLKPL
jgi:hypothetical protein